MRLLGLLVLTFTASMVTMLPFALWYREFAVLLEVFFSMLLGGGIGGLLYFVGRDQAGKQLFRREALAVVSFAWILVGGIGALPFFLGGMTEGYTDAFFESVSGLTTTGASILNDIESQAKTLLFWRSFLHFVGGLGIIVIFVAILPILGVGGKALFKQEVPGPVPEGLTPRIKDTALALCRIYIAINVIEMIILKLCGMTYYDAINHALATMATGGFSTKNASIAAFSPLIEWVMVVFMFIAGTNFSLHLRASKGDFLCYLRDKEFLVYLGIVVGLTFFFGTVLYFSGNKAVSNPGSISFRDSIFTSLTIMTTTGFGTVDFDQWPPVCRGVIVMLMFVGGMAGSTAGGMKVIRWVILLKASLHQLSIEASPRVVRVLKISGRVLDSRAQADAFSLFFLWISVFVGGTVIVAMITPEQSIISSMTAVASCLNNIGPGLEMVGPKMNYYYQNEFAKWILSLLMIMGRLELYAILIMFTPSYWLRR